MRNFYLIPLILLLCAYGIAAEKPADGDLGGRVWVRSLTENAWLVRSVSKLGAFGDVESNAILVAGRRESVLIDTPATNEQTALVLDWAEKRLQRPVRHLLITHWHEDRMGGIDEAQKRGISTYAMGRTIDLARQHGLSLPERELRDDQQLELSGVSMEVYYPGHGHTADNIVVWIAQERLLDGGCFVKSASSTTLGNPAEINPQLWIDGIDRVRRRYTDAKMVIPGHGEVGGAELLQHTAELLNAFNAKR